MFIVELIFIAGGIILMYSYLGYGILLKILNFFKNDKSSPANSSETLPPEVTLIVAAYNEAEFIETKIKNTLSLNYPEEKLKIIFITDGSSDATPEIIKQFPRITLLHKPERRGKVAAMHRAMDFVTTPYVIFSDANTLLNPEAIKNITAHYSNPKVGGVAGEKKIMQIQDGFVTAAGEGLYWKYESYLKKLDWQFYSVVGAAGELFSIRTALYENPGEDVLLDDFVISLRVCQKGYRIAYEPDAYAMETPSASLKEEQKRKIRISAGAFQSMYMLRGLLNIFKYPKLSFQYISHRVLRWTICPLLLPVLFICNVILAWKHPSIVYDIILALQIAFYFMVLVGWMLSRKQKPGGVLFVPYYFFFINYSLYIGFARYLSGKQNVLWDKAKRKSYSESKAAG